MRKSYSRNTFRGVLAGAALLAIPSLASSDETYQAFGHVTVPGNPLVSFDISWVDPTIPDYFLADRNNKSIDVIPIQPFPPVFQIIPTGVNAFAGTALCNPPRGSNDCVGPNGVITFKNADNGNQTELWVGDGPTQNSAACGSSTPCSTVKVFTASGGPTHVINTRGSARADELCFDPVHKVVVMANDADAPPFVSFISTTTYQVIGKIAFQQATNGIEQCQWNPVTGKIYLNFPEVNGPGDDSVPGAVVTFAAGGSGVIIEEFDFAATTGITLCAGPQGMDIRANGDLLLGCNATSIPSGLQNSVIVSATTPNVVLNTLTDLGGADQVWFDSASGHFFVTGGSHLPFEQLAIVDSAPVSNDVQGPGFQEQTLPVGFIGSTTRRTHSVAAWSGTLAGLPLTIAFMPIPAVGGTPAPFSSTICGNDAAKGCVSFFTALTAGDADD
jgi:hypothetical protein